jgi:POT family proton-dependent oligopeptide transporter
MQSPRELWMINAIVLFHGFLYYAIVIVLPMFLSEEFGYSDTLAGIVYGAMGASYTAFAIMLGTVVDRVGVKMTQLFSSVALVVGAVLLAFAFNEVLMFFAIIFFLPLGGSVSYPAGKIATRRYTTKKTRSIAFSLFFMTSQLSAVFGFGAADVFTHNSHHHVLSVYRQIFLLSGTLMIITVFLSFFLREIDFERSGTERVEALGSQYSTC